MIRSVFFPAAAAVLLSACAANSGNMSMTPPAPVAEAIRVPAGNKMAMQTVGSGQLLYECRVKANTQAEHEWVFVGPTAVLKDRSGATVGKYYGPPATWESSDGSKVTATQVATAPGGDGNIPHQLVKANPAMGAGSMMGVTFIQRVATKGGVAPSMPCSSANVGAKQTVGYQADYLFWKAS
ncbi:DUF3455 domain-containing protein [Cupriavidus sp. SW-Y-13]|uniref:DUF3455 domain-containing protein n=1 Tax=Cupriavidus sp. SW-Y-13 TaxID=2653854 RepID=UPI0013651C50|nr:DUF3455 domain-containing protein [Cupriavidus sp. SW-Y-13]MWL90912.1 DUF3455 domain-containing protein [Cupriavidus sp. SW-Y-13]